MPERPKRPHARPCQSSRFHPEEPQEPPWLHHSLGPAPFFALFIAFLMQLSFKPITPKGERTDSIGSTSVAGPRKAGSEVSATLVSVISKAARSSLRSALHS